MSPKAFAPGSRCKKPRRCETAEALIATARLLEERLDRARRLQLHPSLVPKAPSFPLPRSQTPVWERPCLRNSVSSFPPAIAAPSEFWCKSLARARMPPTSDSKVKRVSPLRADRKKVHRVVDLRMGTAPFNLFNRSPFEL